MKLSTAIVFLLSAATSCAALSPIRATENLMKQARRLEDANGDDQEEEEEYAFLANYKIKMIQCIPGEAYVNPEDGEYEYSSVVFRLCPANEGCDDEDYSGCTTGYGDFVVGINSFVQEYLEDKREQMENDDDEFNIEEYGECREFEVDNDADGDDGYQYQYYVGPACGEDGKDIKLDFFIDEGCQTTSEEVTFEDISNGMALPYSSGGLVANACESCSGYNDNGEYELSEFCMRLYENAGKCESRMETYHYMGMQEGSCEYIAELLPVQKKGPGAAIGWTILILVLVLAAVAAYSVMKQKKNEKEFGLMNS